MQGFMINMKRAVNNMPETLEKLIEGIQTDSDN